MQLTIKEIITAVKAKLSVRSNLFLEKKPRSLSIDTRSLKVGDLFVALKGEKNDGHKFLLDAESKGALAVLVEKFNHSLFIPQLIVKDTLFALGQIGKAMRNKWGGQVIAIAGSNGKTTTKNILFCLLEKKIPVLASPASYNNFLGVPLTMQLIKKKHKLCIQEMETNQFGGIARLCEIAQPQIGIITNIGFSHLESLKSLSGVFREKKELIENLPASGIAVLNKDDKFFPKFIKVANNRQYISYGINSPADFQAKNISFSDRGITFTLNKTVFFLPSHFIYDVYNALSAIAVANSIYGISLKECAQTLPGYKPLPLRSQLIKIKKRDFLLDCFNANPSSLTASIENLTNFSHRRKHLLLADMLELGSFSAKLHRQVGKALATANIDKIFAIGSQIKKLIEGALKSGISPERIFYCKNTQEVVEFLQQHTLPADLILVKGSRSMQLEKIVYKFKESQ